MKKIFAALLISAVMVSALAGCSSGENSKVNDIKKALTSNSSNVESSETESNEASKEISNETSEVESYISSKIESSISSELESSLSSSKVESNMFSSQIDSSKVFSRVESSSVSSKTSDKQYSSIKEYISSDIGKEIIESTQNTAGDIMKFELLAEDGNKLVYQYTYLIDTSGVTGDYFSKSIKSYESTYSKTAGYMKDIIDVENPVIVVRYLAEDSSHIYTAEFDENGFVKEIK